MRHLGIAILANRVSPQGVFINVSPLMIPARIISIIVSELESLFPLTAALSANSS